jgi:hypothetical protein
MTEIGPILARLGLEQHGGLPPSSACCCSSGIGQAHSYHELRVKQLNPEWLCESTEDEKRMRSELIGAMELCFEKKACEIVHFDGLRASFPVAVGPVPSSPPLEPLLCVVAGFSIAFGLVAGGARSRWASAFVSADTSAFARSACRLWAVYSVPCIWYVQCFFLCSKFRASACIGVVHSSSECQLTVERPLCQKS